MKKLVSLALVLLVLLSLTALPVSAKSEGYRIAIVQQMDHPSLDEIRTAIESRLTAIAAEQGLTIEFKAFNGQNDASVLNQIGSQAVSDGYDAIIPIATTAAQCMVTAAQGTGIPVIYAAISDPAGCELTGHPLVTGVSDALDTRFILDMMFAQNPGIETVGLLYSNSEANSVTPIADAKAYLAEKNIPYIEKTGNTTDEILTAVSTLTGRVDAVFTPTDNVVMGTAGAVAETLTAAGIPHYTGADSFVEAGAFATCGVNYTDLGAKTADLAVEVMLSGVAPDFQVMEGGIITVNARTAKALGLDIDIFRQMTDTVKVMDAEEAPAETAPAANSGIILSALELGCVYALVALALFLSFRILNIADMTTDGSFTLGCAVSATVAAAGHPILALPAAMLSGAAAGSVTALLQTKMKIPSILAGIITNTGLYTVNLAVMGFSSNVSLLKSDTVFSLLRPYLGAGYRLIPAAILVAVIGILLVLFLKTRLGLSIRATGDNADMVRASSINTAFTVTIGLALANSLTSLSGAVLAQYQKTADINLGTGMVIIGLASLIIGETILPKGKLWLKALGAILGSVVYRFIIALALRMDLPSECLKLISATIVALAIGLPALKAARKGGKAKC